MLAWPQSLLIGRLMFICPRQYTQERPGKGCAAAAISGNGDVRAAATV